jgi:hypothetical protein
MNGKRVLGEGLGTREDKKVMASIDFHDRDECPPGPRLDALGLSFFISHLLVGAYICFGWFLSSPETLPFYLLLLPAVMTQWYVNQGSCVMNNIESWLRSRRWRDPTNPEEAGFLLMLSQWLFRIRPHPVVLDRFSYTAVTILWLLAASRFSWFAMADA